MTMGLALLTLRIFIGDEIVFGVYMSYIIINICKIWQLVILGVYERRKWCKAGSDYSVV